MSKPTDKVVSAGITSALVETEQEDIQHRIFTIRGMQVMLDSDLAKFYGIETKRINEQVKRNPDRFPEDFVFQLTKEEVEFTRSQNATLDKCDLTTIIPLKKCVFVPDIPLKKCDNKS